MSNEEKILQILQTMQADMQGITTRLDNLEGKFDKLEGKVDNLEGRFDKLEGKVDNLEGRFDKLEGKVDKLEGKVDNLEGKVDKLEGKVDKLEAGQATIKADMVTMKEELKVELSRESNAQLEAYFGPKLALLADGHALIVEQMATAKDLTESTDAIQALLDVLKVVVRQHSEDIYKLKKAQ